MPRTSLRRRRVDTTPVTSKLGTLVAKRRNDRHLTQTALANQCGLRGSSAISRLEGGLADHISRDLIEALAHVLEGDADELWSAAGVLPPQGVTKLHPHWKAYEANLLREYTEPAVRRIHLRAMAEDHLETTNISADKKVNIDDLAAALTPTGRRIRRHNASKPSVAYDDRLIHVAVPAAPSPAPEADDAAIAAAVAADERSETLFRFLAAHAVAHLLLDPGAQTSTCTWPDLTDNEVAADELACHLLAPTAVLDRAFTTASTTIRRRNPSFDGWHPNSATLVDHISRGLGIPPWVTLRRIAEDDLLQLHAQDAL